MPQFYGNLLAIAAVILFFSGLPLYLSVFELLTVRSAIWVAGYGILALPLIVLSFQNCIKYCLPLLLWCFGFACISLTWFIFGSQSALAFDGLWYRLVTVTTLTMVVMALLNPTSLLSSRMAVAFWSLLSVGLNIFDLLNPLSISYFPGRASGTYLNPNVSAEALVLGMLLSVTLFPPAWRTLFVLFIGVGVFTTFSRFGLLAYGLGVLGLLFCRLICTKSFLFTLFSAVLVCTTLLATQNWDTFLAGWDQAGLVTSSGIVKGIEERINWFSDPGTSDEAMTERMEGAEQAWRLFAERPFFGGGTGTNFDTWGQSDEFAKPGPHNIYLWLIVDHGIIGALIFPALLLSVTWRADNEIGKLVIISSFIVLLMGFSSHNLLDGRHVLFSLAVLSSMVAQGKRAEERLWENPGEEHGASDNTGSFVSV